MDRDARADSSTAIVEEDDLVKLKINSLRLVACWKWKIDNCETCGICQNEFEQACPACEVPNEKCIPENGKCNHWFHRHCISKWLASLESNGDPPKCPLCRQDWS
ncbi:MAG: hypothetical protein MHMPM18_000469 [Marteilia pararefringens]